MTAGERQSRRRWPPLAGIVLASIVLTANLATRAQVPAASAQQEATTRAKLEQLRADIAQESAARHQAASEQAEANRRLREIETGIGEHARVVAELDAEIGQREQALLALSQQRQDIEAELSQQREKLAALLRAVYALGRDQTLRAWLARDRIADSARWLAYNRYLQTRRLQQMRSLLTALSTLGRQRAAIELAREELDRKRAQGATAMAALASQREQRVLLLAAIEQRLQSHAQRLLAFARDQQSLNTLLARLRDLFADIPRQLVAATAFAELRGRLPRPLSGTVLRGFGAALGPGRVSDGLLIAAQTGAEVHAIAHGRVAYADWLKGYGLLIIVDHGDGYMSLYAQNEALLRDVGDWVEAGSALARAGSSGGGDDPPALYFELRKRGQPLDPKPWLLP